MSKQTAFAESGNSPPLTVKERAKLIRAATPNILAELYEMSNRRCDLCGHPIQDLICAALEHSVPVIFFARSDMPIAEAITQANAPKNLRCAHSSCNTAKLGLTREEWFARRLNERDKPPILTAGQLLELQFRLGAGGRKTKQNGAGIFAPGVAAQGGRCAQRLYPDLAIQRGCKQGRKNTESGHLAMISSLPQAKAAQRRNMKLMQSSGLSMLGSYAAGRKNIESGHIRGLGRIQGRRNAANGHMARIQAAAAHLRWHINRGISNPNCKLCREAA